MKKSLQISFVVSLLLMLGALGASAQMPALSGVEGMRGSADSDNHTAQEEAEGKAIWLKLTAKETECAALSDEDFERLGEYFMGQMMGDAHPAMNAMMERMLGEEGEEQMHVVMGKRLSGCDPTAAYPAGGRGFMPMMQMMWGGWSSSSGLNQTTNPMMWNYGSGFGWFGLGLGWIFMLFWWLLIIAGIVFLVRWFINLAKGGTTWGKSALDILKERYARGEISKQEFEEKKREIA